MGLNNLLKLQKKVKSFVNDEIKTISDFFPRRLYGRMGELGFLKVMAPEKYGGLGLGLAGGCIVSEEVARKHPSLSLSYDCSLFSQMHILMGSEEQKKKYLPGLMDGSLVGALAATEEGAGSDIGSMESTAEKNGDDYVINARKRFITNGGEADVYILYARTKHVGKQHKGITGFIIDAGKNPPVFEKYRLFGCCGASNGALRWENTRVSEKNVIGEENQGFYKLMKAFSPERILLASLNNGIAISSLESIMKRTNEREQFGKKIIDLGNMRKEIGKLTNDLVLARKITYYVARTYDTQCSYEKEDFNAVRGIDSMAKDFSVKTSTRIAWKEIMVHSGNAYCLNLNPEPTRRLRDSMMSMFGGGTSEVQEIIIENNKEKDSFKKMFKHLNNEEVLNKNKEVSRLKKEYKKYFK